MPAKKGFTLIELLVVIAILAVILSVGMVVYNNVQIRIRNAKRKVDIDAMAKAITLFYQANKRWPDTGVVSWTNSNSGINNWPQVTRDDMASFFIEGLPIDPKNGSTNGCTNDICQYYFFTDNPGTICNMMPAGCGDGIASVGANLENCQPGEFLADGPKFDGRPGGCPAYYRIIEKI